MTNTNGQRRRANTGDVDNLQASVESWITNIDSLEIYSLDSVLASVLVNLNKIVNHFFLI